MVDCTFNECFTNRANKSGKYQSLALFKSSGRKGDFLWEMETGSVEHCDKIQASWCRLQKADSKWKYLYLWKAFHKEDVEITREKSLVCYSRNLIKWTDVVGKTAHSDSTVSCNTTSMGHLSILNQKTMNI